MADQPDELVIDFKKPIKNKAQEEVTSITLHEPTADQWAGIDGLSGVKADIAFISAVSGQPPFVIGQMAVSQLVKGATYLLGFIAPVPKTGDDA